MQTTRGTMGWTTNVLALSMAGVCAIGLSLTNLAAAQSGSDQLVEYLKSIPGEAGRVTPFGGPPNAVTGNAPWGKVPAR